MKKIIMSIIGLAIALALVLAIWVPLANRAKTSATNNNTRTTTVESDITSISSPVP